MDKDYEEFVRDRIAQLRMERGVSEYQMSYDLGKSRGYIYHFSSGKGLPPLKELFKIMEYFGLTPLEFFDDNTNPLIREAIDGMRGLGDEDLEAILEIIGRLRVTREESVQNEKIIEGALEHELCY